MENRTVKIDIFLLFLYGEITSSLGNGLQDFEAIKMIKENLLSIFPFFALIQPQEIPL